MVKDGRARGCLALKKSQMTFRWIHTNFQYIFNTNFLRLRICDLRLRARSGSGGPVGWKPWNETSPVGWNLQVRALAEPQWIDGRFVDVRWDANKRVLFEWFLHKEMYCFFGVNFSIVVNNPSIALLYLTQKNSTVLWKWKEFEDAWNFFALAPGEGSCPRRKGPGDECLNLCRSRCGDLAALQQTRRSRQIRSSLVDFRRTSDFVLTSNFCSLL